MSPFPPPSNPPAADAGLPPPAVPPRRPPRPSSHIPHSTSSPAATMISQSSNEMISQSSNEMISQSSNESGEGDGNGNGNGYGFEGVASIDVSEHRHSYIEPFSVGALGTNMDIQPHSPSARGDPSPFAQSPSQSLSLSLSLSDHTAPFTPDSVNSQMSANSSGKKKGMALPTPRRKTIGPAAALAQALEAESAAAAAASPGSSIANDPSATSSDTNQANLLSGGEGAAVASGAAAGAGAGAGSTAGGGEAVPPGGEDATGSASSSSPKNSNAKSAPLRRKSTLFSRLFGPGELPEEEATVPATALTTIGKSTSNSSLSSNPSAAAVASAGSDSAPFPRHHLHYSFQENYPPA